MKSLSQIAGQHRILYGADYNPDQWLDRPDVLERDIALMQQIGMTSASVGIFAWTKLEPQEGVFEFDWLDAVFERFLWADLKIFLATPSGSKPMWLSEAYPEVRRVDKTGRREPSGGRHNHCPTSPVYRSRVQRINRELATRYGGHPSLALWHVGNELSGECHCELCRKAFQDWLQKRYGNLDRLNQAWWTAFWNHSFTDWSQIPTQDASIDGLCLDWLRFMNDQHMSFLQDEMRPLREFAPDVPCTTNFMGTNRSTDYSKWSGILDLISNDLYPLHDDREDSWIKSINAEFIHSLMRGMAGGQPWMLMECAPSAVNWGKVNKLKRPGVLLQETLQAVANGADGVHYFQWRKGRGGYEKYHGAVIDHADDRETRVFRECAQVGAELEKLASVAGHTPERAPVAVIYDWESRWAIESSAGPKSTGDGTTNSDDHHTEACLDHFRALRLAGIEVDVISAEDDFSQYSMVITPALYAVSSDLAKRLSDYAAAGGVWVATYLTAYVDASNLCWTGGFPGAGLATVLGLWNEEPDWLFDDERVKITGDCFTTGSTFEASDIVERTHAEGARILATTESEFYKGSPVITENCHGAGKALYLGARFDESGRTAFYASLADRLELPRKYFPKGISHKVRMGVDGPVEFLFNFLGKAVTVDLEENDYTQLSDHRICRGPTKIEAYETLIRSTALISAQETNSIV